MLAAQSLGRFRCRCTGMRGRECIFPLNNAEVRFAWWKTRSGGQTARNPRAVPADRPHHLRRPRGLRNYNEEGLDALDSLIETGSAFVARTRLVQGRVAKPARRRGGHVLHIRHHRQPQGRGAHPQHAAGPRHRGRRVRQTHQRRRRCWPTCPAWIGQNIFSYAQWLACGYVVNCPRVGQHRHHRPQRKWAPPTLRRRAF